ncbi:MULTISPECIES: hypothetical protein [unclassified Clostridium]|uniref:hypothetical protein n=1 Tax=unclassified Clostridium TaxID=2614128 RepID=UPI0013F91B48|nr:MULTISPECIES: hypothetical protein [unclassified Clostridium]NFR85807.1 hypothetical protein [Clostridium botulinum]NFR91441.1 hypothetical protein [Clostridium botulinum]NFU00122.1 hypothetical protein [Clostridium botulinum]
MQNYIDYNFYKESYGGASVPQGSFLRFSIKASTYIDKITFGRVKKLEDIPTEVKFAVCSTMEVMKKIEDDGGVISSESEGKHSVSYVDGISTMSEEKKINETATLFLANTGLLYKGFIKGVDTVED